MADKKISELDLALLINDDAEFPFSQENAGEPTTFKGRITQLGTKIAEDMTFSNLRTTSKKLVGAINELLSLGSPIIIGTTAPTSSIGADNNIYVQYTAGTGGADDEVDGIFVKIDGAWCEISTGGGSGTTDYEALSNKPKVNSVELVGNKSLDDLGIMPASLSKTVSGSIAHFTDGADNIPVKSLVSEIVAVESGNGQPKSPTNPYTISGFDNGVVGVCGKNLFNFSPTTVTSSRTIASNIFLKTGTYICSFFVNNTTSISGYFQVRIGTTSIGGVNFPANYQGIVRKAFTLSEDSTVNIFVGGASAGYNFEFSNGQIELGVTSTTYEAYNGNTYTFAFGQTVYGGHFDNKGNLVVTHGFIDLSSLSWGGGTYNIFEANVNDIKPPQTPSERKLGIVCDSYPVSEGTSINNTMTDKSMLKNSTVLYIRNTDYSTSSDFANSLNGVYLAYELATPNTLTITSQDIPTLLGENNIFSNCGDVEVDYYTDKADEIAEVAKATASTPLHNYSTDEQIVGTWIDGSTLYEKTFVFSSGLVCEAYTWTVTTIDVDFNKVIQSEGTSDGTANVSVIAAKTSDGKLQIMNLRNATLAVGSATICYTKSST